eukprot:CAMPEP_0170161254 /NCGR_PEP_ID=MMETSP0033_2-20121228/75661_1 /TAXON_ID=195969 /ORGANISM="Dolichomastix tenuilepis, Strain CCMP3274" /LENGTH=87 /DNA_ID=CAMNT_0010398849 /DNA_START=17 /DNA_END=276 /DNA_ORIENTATION=+
MGTLGEEQQDWKTTKSPASLGSPAASSPSSVTASTPSVMASTPEAAPRSPERGVLVRSLERVFEHAEQLQSQGKDVDVHLSYFQFYR